MKNEPAPEAEPARETVSVRARTRARARLLDTFPNYSMIKI